MSWMTLRLSWMKNSVNWTPCKLSTIRPCATSRRLSTTRRRAGGKWLTRPRWSMDWEARKQDGPNRARSLTNRFRGVVLIGLSYFIGLEQVCCSQLGCLITMISFHYFLGPFHSTEKSGILEAGANGREIFWESLRKSENFWKLLSFHNINLSSENS